MTAEKPAVTNNNPLSIRRDSTQSGLISSRTTDSVEDLNSFRLDASRSCPVIPSMKLKLSILPLLLLLMASGCYKKDQQPLEHTTIDKVCTEAFHPFYDERKYSKFHHVDFVGYLATPKSAMISNTMFVEVFEKPNREGVKLLASFHVGSRDNYVERLKSGYKESDLKIKSDTGAILGNGSKVTIEGDVSPGAVPGKFDGKSCYVRVDKVLTAN